MYVYFDIGGTNLRCGISSSLEKIDKVIEQKTPKDFFEAKRQVDTILRTNTNPEEIKYIIVGIAGVLDETKKRLVKAPHLSSWEDESIAFLFGDAKNAKIIIENDTAMVGLGELYYGSGAGSKIMAYISLGTGLGGCRFVNGKIDNSTHGFEPGHHYITENKTFEQIVSGTAVLEKFGIQDITLAPERVWDELAVPLARGLYNTTLFWSPDTIVVGGSMATKKVVVSWDKTLEEYAKLPKIFSQMPTLQKAKLGSIGGLYGGMALVNQLVEEEKQNNIQK
ncbi:ROK family protein [Candidatus Nomurabacteria bacterium]|nr:ROK family protein [Candidatus Nomurabacteria bacterium]USN94700.1 MAG: ROK family protein [Candidatus Nomurabacteria bacterium]